MTQSINNKRSKPFFGVSEKEKPAEELDAFLFNNDPEELKKSLFFRVFIPTAKMKHFTNTMVNWYKDKKKPHLMSYFCIKMATSMNLTIHCMEQQRKVTFST